MSLTCMSYLDSSIIDMYVSEFLSYDPVLQENSRCASGIM